MYYSVRGECMKEVSFILDSENDTELICYLLSLKGS